MGELRISLLGSFQASFDDRPLAPFRTSKVQALLIYLAVEALSEPTVTHRREALMELLWPGLPLKSAQDNLRQTLYQLRKAIPQQATGDGQSAIHFVESSRLSVGISPDYQFDLDVAEFCQYLSRNRLEEAVALYRGDFLANFYLPDSGEFEAWATAWRSELRRQALDALDGLTVIRLKQGQFNQAQGYAQQQLAIDDLRERAYRQSMAALAHSGQRSAALAQYERCRHRLAEDLGIAPTQETQDLYRRIEADQLAPPTAIKAAAVEKPIFPPVISGEDEGSIPVFVARERELASLASTLDRACAGQGGLSFVVGGAGRGKTTLVVEFARRAQGVDPDLLVASGHCRGQAGFGDPYLPFREALAQLSGDVVTRSGGDLVTRQQAQRLWTAMPLTVPLLVGQAPDLVDSLILGTDLRHRAATFAGPESPWFRQLCARLDNPYRQNLRQDRLFSQVTALLKAIAAERPLLLILEDLHYADPASISLLFHLSREIGECPVFLLGTYRPEEIVLGWGEGKHPLANIIGELKRRHGDIWLDLGKTTAAEGRAFVDAFLDSEPNRLDENFRSALFEHTGGHALFTVELLRAMQERGDLVQDEDGCWLASEVVDWHTLPAKVEGVIEQRLSRLDAGLQSALAIASVEGETFTAEVVARVQKGEESGLVRRLSREVEKLHRLVQAEALAWAGSQRLSRYRFRHQLFQQYLYQSLDEMERAYLHEDVGRALEGLYGPEVEQVAVRLAWHFERAGLTEQAIDYLIQVARQAVRLGANDQVIEYCTQGLTLLETLPDSAQKNQQELALQIIQGNVFIATKGYGSPEVEMTFARSHELCRQVGQTPQLSRVLFGLWGYYFHQAEYPVALELGEQALRLAQQQPEPGPILNAHRLVGVILFYLGKFVQSLEHMEQVISDYDPELHGSLGLLYGSDPCLSALSFAALSLMYMGYPDRALAYSQRALRLARELSNPFALAFTLLLVCWLHAVRMDPQGVLKYVGEQIALTSEHRFPLQLAMAKYHLHWARGMSGEAAESIPRMLQAVADWQATGAQCGKSANLGGLARVCLEAGQTEDGLSFSAEAIDHRRRTGERFYEAEQYWIRGELLRQQGASDQEVEAEFQRSINVARQLNARLSELQATICLCRLWQQQGRKEEARPALAEIYGWFTEGFDSPDLLAAKQLLEELS